MFVYDSHPVREALRRRPHKVARVLVSATCQRKLRQEIERLCLRHHLPCEVVSERTLTAVAGWAHNGLAAELRPAAGVEGAAEEAASTGSDLLLLLEDVRDPSKLESALRICETEVSQVFVRERGSALITAAVAKTASGASEWLLIERITNSAATLDALKQAGYRAYGTDPAGLNPWALDFTGKVVLCIGLENKGLRLRTRTRALCDATIGLPDLDSRDVATAVWDILFSVLHRRRDTRPGP
jgi:23S rRNA (guanosine2251-2'-O)-methyltransferase